MTLELSDQYELFDAKFKAVVPKTHSQIRELMALYVEIRQGTVKRKGEMTTLETQLRSVLDEQVNYINCQICF